MRVRRSGARRQGNAYAVVVSLFLLLVGFLFIFPFVAMVLNAFKPEKDIIAFSFLPRTVTMENFHFILHKASISLPIALKNSAFVATARTAITLYLASLWGYALAKLRFKGRNVLFYLVLSAMMVPVAVILLPLYQQMIWLRLKGSLWSLILIVNGTTSYAVFIMRQFMGGIPEEMLESGRIDGCGEFQIFHKLVFPMLTNAISSVCIIVFLYVWNDYLWPFISIDAPEKYTVTVAMQFFSGRYTVQYGPLMAATTLSLLPIMIVYFIFQRRFTQGISTLGLKE